MRATFDSPPGEHRWDTHREFHTRLISPAGTEWDLRLLRPLWDAAERYTRLAFDPVDISAETEAARARAHDELVRCAATRDPGRVRDELGRHLRNNLTETLEAFETVRTLSDPAPSRSRTKGRRSAG